MIDINTNIIKYEPGIVKDAIETEIVTINNSTYNYSKIPIITVYSDDTCFIGNTIDIHWKIESTDPDSLNEDDKLDILYVMPSGEEFIIAENLDIDESVYTWNNTLSTDGLIINFKIRYSDYNEVYGISSNVLIRSIPDYTLYNLIKIINDNGKIINDESVSLYKGTDFTLQWKTPDLVTIEYGIEYSSIFYPLSVIDNTIKNECSILVPNIDSDGIRFKIYNTKYTKYEYISDLIKLNNKILKFADNFINLQLVGNHEYNIDVYTEGIKHIKIQYSTDYENWINIDDNFLITKSNESIRWIVPDVNNEFTFIKLIERENESNYIISDSFKILKQGEVKFIYPFLKGTSLPVNSEISVMFYACDVKNIRLEFDSEPYMENTWNVIYEGGIISDKLTDNNPDFCYHIHYYTDDQLSENYKLRLTNIDTGQTVISPAFRIADKNDFNSDKGTLSIYLATDIGMCNNVLYKLMYKDHFDIQRLAQQGVLDKLSTSIDLKSFENLYSYNYVLELSPSNMLYETVTYEVGKPHSNLNKVFRFNRRKSRAIVASDDIFSLNNNNFIFRYNLINVELGIKISDCELNYNNRYINSMQLFLGEWTVETVPVLYMDKYSYIRTNKLLKTDFTTPYNITMNIKSSSSVYVQDESFWKITNDDKCLFTGGSGYKEIDLTTHMNDVGKEVYDFYIVFNSDCRIKSNNDNVIRVPNDDNDNIFNFKVSKTYPIITLNFSKVYDENHGEVLIYFDDTLDPNGSIEINSFINENSEINYIKRQVTNNTSFVLPIGKWILMYGNYYDSREIHRNVQLVGEKYADVNGVRTRIDYIVVTDGNSVRVPFTKKIE